MTSDWPGSAQAHQLDLWPCLRADALWLGLVSSPANAGRRARDGGGLGPTRCCVWGSQHTKEHVPGCWKNTTSWWLMYTCTLRHFVHLCWYHMIYSLASFFYSRLEMIMMCCSTLSHCLPFWCAIKLPNLMPVYSEWRRATRTRILHPLGFWTLVIPHPLNPVCAKTRLRCARHCPSSYCVATLFFFTI